MGMDHEKVTSGHISEGKNGYHSPPEAINCQQPLSHSQTSETCFLPMLECWQATSSSDLVQVPTVPVRSRVQDRKTAFHSTLAQPPALLFFLSSLL